MPFPDYQELYGLVARPVKLPSTAWEPCVRVLIFSERIQKMASAAPFTLSPAAASSSGPLNQKSRGPGFQKEEDLKLAKAWVRASREGTNTDMNQFWNTVAKYLNAMLESRRARSVSSIRSRWTMLQRIAQKYLIARNVVLASIPSGTNPDDQEVLEQTMELYCSSNSIKGEGDVAHSAPPVKFVDACLFLSREPKFSDPPSRATTAKADAGRHNSFQGVDPVEGVITASDGENVHESSKSAPGVTGSRPHGIKRKAKATTVAECNTKIAKSVDSVAKALEINGHYRNVINQGQLQLQLLREINMTPEEKQCELRRLYELQKTNSVSDSTANASKNAADMVEEN
jgi:hypothetical protein